MLVEVGVMVPLRVTGGRYVTVNVSVPVLPALSFAVTVIVFDPDVREMFADQDLVPVHVPLLPALEDHVTEDTPLLSDAVPEIVKGVELEV